MNTLEQISIRSPADKNETCAKFVIDDISFPFVFHDVANVGQKYTLGFYVKSEAAGSLTIFDKVYNTTSEWQKIAITFDSTETNISIFFSTLGTYYLYHTQLEIGNKDTDFERAPEDIEEDIQSVSKKTAELIVDLDAITSRVYSVEQDATSLESRVSTAESKLTKDGLVTTIGSYYTTLGQLNNAIDGIDIGGRNLLRNSNFKNGSQHWLGVNAPLNVIADSVYGNALSFYTTIKGSVSDRIYYDTSNQGFSHVAGETYTLSFFAKASVNTKLQSSVAGNATSIETYELTTTWQRFTHTYTAPQHGSLSFWPVDANVTIYLTNVKLEKGNKATDWTPAPEDVDASISHATSVATQTAEKFNWLVKSGTSSTDFTLTDRTATLIAQTINLNGDVKVNGDMLVDGVITTAKLATDAIKSTNYAYSSGNYSTAGTYFDLSTGSIRSKNFAITTTGDVYFKGNVDATTITAKDEYKIYTGSYGNETIIHAYDWGGDGQRAVEFGLPNTTYPSVIYMFTSSSGSVLSFYATGNASFNCTVYFEGMVNIYGKTTITSTLTVSSTTTINGYFTSSADTSLRFPIGAGTQTANPSVQLRKAGNAGSYTLSLVYYNADGGTTFNNLINADGSRNWVPIAGGTFNGAITVKANIASTGVIYANTFSNNSGNLTTITGISFILLQANGFALRVGEGVNGASYKVLMPVTTANAASNDVVYLGVPSARWKFIYSASSVNVSSDERDKDITELDERYLDAFHKLNVITYRWKNDPEKLHIGFSAQAVKRAMNTHGIDTTDMGAICHDFWTDEETGEEKERYSLCYEEITLLTVPVVQKHSVTLTEHAAKLVNIESQLESLKTELDEAHIEIARLKKLVNVS